MQLHRAHERFREAGVDLVLIGQASPRQATAFRRKVGIDTLPVLADDDRQTYRIAGWRKAGLGQLLGPRSVVSGLKHSRRSGVVQGRIVGDASQLGGAMIIRPGGDVVLHRASENAGDTIEPDELLAAAA